jgi:hypothetical protein
LAKPSSDRDMEKLEKVDHPQTAAKKVKWYSFSGKQFSNFFKN